MANNVKAYSAPYSCYVNLTNKCNLNCLHCLGDYSNSIEGEFKFKDWKNVFDELTKNKVFYVNISGGEPTQYRDFEKIISYLTKIKLHFILTTNGVFSKNVLDTILKSKECLIGIKISLDGYDAKSHCFIRRVKSGSIDESIFKITMENIKRLKQNKIPLSIATAIHSKNINNFDKFVKLIKSINPVSWFISPILPSGRGVANRIIKEDYRYYKKSFWHGLVKKCNSSKINVKLIDLPFNMQKKTGIDYYECGASLSFCEINADGQVSPCTLCRTCIPKRAMRFESLKDKSLKEIWNGQVFRKFRKLMTEGCNGCQAFSKCNKCIAQSFSYFKNGTSPTPYCLTNPVIGLKERAAYTKKLNEGGISLK